jgi:hypothetical protein
MKKGTASQTKGGRSARGRRSVARKRRDAKKEKHDEGTPPPWLRLFTAAGDNRLR